MQFLLLWNEMTPGNFNFLLYCIATQLDYFKAVTKGRLNILDIVGCSYKQYLTQVIFQFKIVIIETIVLLGVKHFKQGGGRIAPKVAAHFIDLIQYHNRVGRLNFAN